MLMHFNILQDVIQQNRIFWVLLRSAETTDIIEGPCINFPVDFNTSKYLPIPLHHASSYGLKVLIPAGKHRDHLEDCSCIRAFIRSKCTYIKIETCGARVLYKQDPVKFLQAEASGEMKQGSKCDLDKVESSRLCQVSPYSFT